MDNAIDTRKVLSTEEFESFERVVKKLENPAKITLLFIAETGCRIGEALLLRPEDVQFLKEGRPFVRIQTLKRDGHPVRSVHLDRQSEFYQELRSWTATQKKGEALFPIPKRTLQSIMKKILKRVKPDREGLVHILRHTRASRLSQFGAKWEYIQQQLGWSSLDMARIYAHTQDEEIEKVFQSMRKG